MHTWFLLAQGKKFNNLEHVNAPTFGKKKRIVSIYRTDFKTSQNLLYKKKKYGNFKIRERNKTSTGLEINICYKAFVKSSGDEQFYSNTIHPRTLNICKQN